MISVALDYDADQDWLDISFGNYDGLTREFVLNDHVIVTTDTLVSKVVHVGLREYIRMLLVSETEFTNLQDEEPDIVEDLLYLMTIPPLSRLFDLTDPDALVARVCAPSLNDLVDDTDPRGPRWL